MNLLVAALLFTWISSLRLLISLIVAIYFVIIFNDLYTAKHEYSVIVLFSLSVDNVTSFFFLLR